MYFSASDSSHMLYLATSRECFHRLAYYHQIKHHFVFCVERNPQIMSQLINKRALIARLMTGPPVSTMPRNKCSLSPKRPFKSTHTHQNNLEPTNPNDLSIPNPVFAPNLTAPIPHAPLNNQPAVHKTFQKN